jgi:hypothetical protein
VDAGITRLQLKQLSHWGGGQESTSWAGVPHEAVRLPALRHLDLHPWHCWDGWAQHGAAHMRGAARLVAAHAGSLRTLRLSFWITSPPESHPELAALEGSFLESVLLAAPLPALRRLDLSMDDIEDDDEALGLEALRPLARLSLPRLTRLRLDAYLVTGQGVRWLEGAHLPALRRLGVEDFDEYWTDNPCLKPLAAPRWPALETLELKVSAWANRGMAALSAALAPTLRRLVVKEWPFGGEGCAEEWPQLRSLGVDDSSMEIHESGILVYQLGPVRLPRLERLAVGEDSSWANGIWSAFLKGFADLRPSIPALRVVELRWCVCGNDGCPVVGCTRPTTVALLAELRAAWPGLELRRFEEEDWTRA